MLPLTCSDLLAWNPRIAGYKGEALDVKFQASFNPIHINSLSDPIANTLTLFLQTMATSGSCMCGEVAYQFTGWAACIKE